MTLHVSAARQPAPRNSPGGEADPPRTKKRKTRLRAVGQLFAYFAGTGRWWLIPLVVVLGLATVVLIGIKIAQYAAPFVYTLF